MLDFDGHWYVQASYGAAGWARNLRAAGKATVIYPGGRRSLVHASEVPPDEAAAILRRVVEPYRQLHLLRRLLGLRVRPPVALPRRYRIRIDDTPQEYPAELGVIRCSNCDPRNDSNDLFAIAAPVARQYPPLGSHEPAMRQRRCSRIAGPRTVKHWFVFGCVIAPNRVADQSHLGFLASMR
jgi:hypothetical protein